MAIPKSNKPVPIALRHLDLQKLYNQNPCERTIILGSFWPNTESCFESHIVKSFKECRPIADYEPYISALCSFYADLIINACAELSFDYIVRVLSSSETIIDNTRPQSLLVKHLCDLTKAQDMSNYFFKSATRPPMRTIPRLSGPDALKSRMQYVVQDLFVKPDRLSGNVLLVDDIYNNGASMRVYAEALKIYMSAQCVYGVNLAATRFNRGKDGLGMLKLDKSSLESYTTLNISYLDSDGIYHKNTDCTAAKGKLLPRLHFMCERSAKPCHNCLAPTIIKQSWWKFWENT